MMAPAYAFICASLITGNSQSQLACSKAMEAYFFEYRLDDHARNIQKKATKIAEEQLGREASYGIATLFVLTSQKSFQASTSQIPYVQQTTIRVRPDTTTITLGWRF